MRTSNAENHAASVVRKRGEGSCGLLLFGVPQFQSHARIDNPRRADPKRRLDIVSFELAGQPFMGLSAGPMFKFNEAISFLIPCETQEEIDYYWEKLSADPAAEQCGWLKDKFGLSWQVSPRALGEMMEKGTPEQVARVTKAMLAMKKFDIAALEKAYKR
jgi:predicted 3-demethylubiquinone-9 3-methyltransferase (glyoxalase superfamily)